MDEARISNVARYDANFEPRRRFEPDEHTLALYHFDEGEGDVLKDASGNGHHGKIVGAKWVETGVEAASDRSIAEWILANGGRFETNLEPGKDLTAAAELPAGPFRITRVEELKLRMPIAEADEAVQRLAGLTECDTIRIVDGNLGDDGLTFLKSLPQLRSVQFIRVRGLTGTGLAHLAQPEHMEGIAFNGAKAAAEAFDHVARCKNLTFLDVNGSGIDDGQLGKLAGLTRLGRLWLPSNPITDAGLKHLTGMTNLRDLQLQRTGVTAAGIAELEKALPGCKIKWDEVATAPAGAAPPPAVVGRGGPVGRGCGEGPLGGGSRDSVVNSEPSLRLPRDHTASTGCANSGGEGASVSQPPLPIHAASTTLDAGNVEPAGRGSGFRERERRATTGTGDRLGGDR